MFLLNLKEFFLVISVLYFYGLAFGMHFDQPLFGMDRPAIFLSVCAMYLLAIAMEMGVTWWKSRNFIIWATLWLLSYAIIGLYVAPTIFGPSILLYILLEPLVIVFIGGFVFGYSRLLASLFFKTRELQLPELEKMSARLPGWTLENKKLNKTYVFSDFDEALNFFNRAVKVVSRARFYPQITIKKERVTFCFAPSRAGTYSKSMLNLARLFDSFS
jgi:pterin-4a-carbinolamine dehydratase